MKQIIKQSIKGTVTALLLITLLLPVNKVQAQSDEVEYQEAPSSIGEDNDDRLRRQQEEESKQQHYYSSPGGGSVNRSSEEDGANPPNPGDDPGPIDGGLSVLLAAGAAYGVRRMRKASKVDGPQSTDDSK